MERNEIVNVDTQEYYRVLGKMRTMLVNRVLGPNQFSTIDQKDDLPNRDKNAKRRRQ